jgi:glycosyltransferase involved in cell wall biosynthesis
MENTALIVSRKFNPGHYSHAAATAKLLRENGWQAYLYLHPLFARMHAEHDGRLLTTLREAWQIRPVKLLVVWFPSLRAIADIILARMVFGAQIIYVFHEPFESIASYRKAGFGILKTFRVCLISAINYLIAVLSHKIILSSRRAAAVYRDRYAGIRKSYAVIPLLFDDELGDRHRFQARDCISYIGTIAADHAFEEFLQFVARAFEEKWFADCRYLIATSSSLSSAQQAVIKPLREAGKLMVKQGVPLSNDEINDCYACSLVVWNAYKRSMQSGVLPKAYMFGTPVLIANSNRSEFFVDHQNGVMIDDRYGADQIKDAIAEIITHFATYSAHCRKVFMETFYYRAQSQSFMRLAAL